MAEGLIIFGGLLIIVAGIIVIRDELTRIAEILETIAKKLK